ncbi:CHAT domain-containing protein [Pleurocapsa sp. PCC 7319]|uniref:CHAT domain-containing protein n=1 Tax=Pleurocapsa sp. PCC 7319 TaxID=118161 RepID=UPI00037AFA20|nr:CHAT domain-containing protein [Pleurocapsa sp. PCC 7319]
MRLISAHWLRQSLFRTVQRSLIIGLWALTISLGIHSHSKIQAQTSESALVLIEESKEYYDRGQFVAATEALQQALQIYQRSGERIQQARTFSLLSLAYEQLGEWQQAEKAITKSLSILDTLPKSIETKAQNQSFLDRVRAQVLNRQGRWQLARGQAKAAIETAEKAELFYTRSGDTQGIFISKINQAQAWQTLGFFRRTTKILDGLVQQLEDQPPSLIQVNSLNSLGSLFRQQGNLERSSEILSKSLALAQKLNLDSEISPVLLNLGNTKQALASQARSLNDLEQANNYQQQAEKHYQQVIVTASFPLNRIQAQLNQFRLLIDSELLVQQKPNPNFTAQNFIFPISQALEKLPASRQTIYANINFARSLMKIPSTSNYESLITTTLNKAIAQAQSLEDPRSESFAIGTLGQFYEQTDKLQLAQKLTNSALAIAQKMNAPDLSYKWEWQLGRLLANEQKRQQAISAYTEAVNDLQLLRRDLAAINTDIQFSFREQVEPVYRQLVGLLLQHDSQQELSQQNLRQARQAIESLQLAQLENFFRSACLNAEPEQLDRIVESDPTTAVFYPIILPERFEVIFKLPGQKRLQHYHSDRPQAEVKEVLAQLQQYLNEPDRTSDVKKLSQELYSWLIEPVATELETSQVKTLVFVLDGALRNIPMGVLYDSQNQQYLLEKYAIAVAPGLQLLDPKPLAGNPLNALIGGLEEERQVGGKEFSRLNNVSLELKQIQSQVAKGEQLLDRSFTSDNLRDRIDREDFSVIHLATHGQFSSQLEETFILTWNQLLKISDLDDLLQLNNPQRNSIELLVLSACETAVGDERAALGLAGIAVRAGARSTLATLWAVDDLSTARLMGEFYRQLANNQISKAEALRRAQLELWKEQSQDWQRPYFWASYILVGNWL